ncbi:MAG: FtsX-like permease family protein [Deltaproteobacteria bacterium]|nr:FtsX-like permease family protein [Deltaproteobacteria bacterium]
MKNVSPFFWFKLALRELLNNRRFSLFFLFNLALGLAGFIALDSFKESLDNHLGQNSQAILGADVALTSYLPFEEKTLDALEAKFPPNTLSTRKTTLFTMVASKDQTRLVQVTGIEAGFPFYGKMVLKKNGVVQEENIRQSLNTSAEAWVYPELLFMLGLKVGGSIKIGEQSFSIADTVIDDPSSSFSSFGLAPRVYLGYSQMQETGLLSKKSRVSYQRLYRLPEGTDLSGLVVDLQNQIKSFDGSDSKIRILTHKRAGNNLGRLLGYLNDYLGLVAMIAVFLAGIGAAYLFRNYLVHRFREISILMSLGATRQQTYRMVLWQLGLLGTGAALIAIIISLAILPLLPLLLKQFLPSGFETQLSLGSLLFALVLGGVGSLVFCLPVLTKIRNVQPLQLFHGNIGQQDVNPAFWRQALSYLPLLILSWSLSVWQSHSLIVGSAFVGMLLLSILFLGSLAWLVLFLAGKFSQTSGSTMKRLAFRNLQRNRTGAISCFLALALGTLLINLIPQIYQGLQEEVSRPDDFRIPSLFLFDIQPEQMEPLRKTLAAEKVNLNYLSPMVRARLEKVNGKSFDVNTEEVALTREQERQQNFRRHNLNLSYRTQLADSEQIVEGRPLASKFAWDSGKPAEVSLEVRYAERMGFKLGDLLTFNVQEVLVEAIVINLRRVQWNSFQPNFFILFQPGVLEDAPGTFLGSIGGLDATRRLNVQNRIVSDYPNVSVIDVTRMVGRVLKISDQMVLALRLMAYLSILAGLVVVFSIARHEVEGRLWELNLLKVLGARFSDIQKMIQIEFAVLGIFAGLFGVAFSLIMSYGISWWFFENLWKWTWQTSLGSIIGVTALSVGVAWLATQRTLRSSPLTLLRSS